MNIKRQVPCFLLIGSLLLGSCENEQITDMEKQGTELPDGKYPLTFTAVQTAPIATPQTRVSENTDGMSSKWDGGEVIKVQIANGKAGTYTLDNTGKTTAQTPCYWQNTQSATINAWYSNITGQNTDDETVDLNNQQNGLAYVLKAVTTADYKTSNLELKFQHQLAKVRVKLEGEKADDVTSVQVNNYASCTVTNGNVSADNKNKGYIPMCKNGKYYEANVVPMGTITADDFIRLNDDTKASINDITELKAGNVYTITLTVGGASLKPGSDGKFTINEGDDVLIKDYNGTAPIVVNGDATITLDNVKLTTEGTAMEINNGATVTLNVKGMDNELTSTGGAGIKIMESINTSPGGSITINGTGASSSKLKVTAASGAAIGFRMYGGVSGSWVTIYGGDIEIKNIKLEAQGGPGSPAIGLSALENDAVDCQKKYGNISIDASTLIVSSTGGAACIGTPKHNTSSPFSLEIISIINSTVTATAEGNQAACIGFGYTANTAGNTKKVIQKINFTNTTFNLTTDADNKVGFGDGDDSRQLTDGIWNNGSKVGETGWNP